MIYRRLGRTDLKVSQLGFGAMRLPMTEDGSAVDTDKTVAMMHRAFEAGVNYVDSAVFYCKADSQRAVGEAIQGWRDKLIVSTKNHYYEEDESAWWQNLEDSLRLLQVDCIDIYNQHGMSWERFTRDYEPRVYNWVRKAQDQGLIRHICCSFHDNCEAMIKLVDSDLFSAMTVQYNLIDQSLAEGITHAHAKDIGVVVMGPIGGGMLGENSQVLSGLLPGIKSTAEMALRFVLSNPNVSLAFSGMNEMEQVEENLAVATDGRILTADDLAAIEARMGDLKGMADLYCTYCNYCQPCPAEVAIPEVFHKYNRGRVYGLWSAARKGYAQIGSFQGDTRKQADACTDCGECEDKCPQNIPIRKQLAEAHEILVTQSPSK